MVANVWWLRYRRPVNAQPAHVNAVQALLSYPLLQQVSSTWNEGPSGWSMFSGLSVLRQGLS